MQVVHGVTDGGLCSVVFQARVGQEWAVAAEHEGGGTDGAWGLTWLHVHETPLPTEVKDLRP